MVYTEVRSSEMVIICIILVVGFLMIFSTGCMPWPMAKTPAVQGTVLNKTTEIPIANAKVYFEEYPQTSTTTDDEGRFSIKPHIGLGFITVGCPIPPHGTIMVEKSGFAVESQPVGSYGRKVLNVKLNAEDSEKSPLN